MKSVTDDIDVLAIPGFREPVNCFTHFLAVLVFSILSFYLIRQGRGSWLRTVSLGVMAFSSVFLLSMSTVYHLLAPGTGRDVMRQLDIAGVFALIAGTMTPIHAILDRGFKRWASLFLVWSAAVTGITLRTVFSGRPSIRSWDCHIPAVRLVWTDHVYFALEAIQLLLRQTVVLGRCCLLAGCCRSGTGSTHPHFWGGRVRSEVWHLAVVTGLGLHWRFVFQFAHGPPHAGC